MGIRFHLIQLLLVFVMLACTSCAGGEGKTSEELNPTPLSFSQNQLPGIPGLDGARETSAAAPVQVDQTQFLNSGGVVQNQGGDILLDSDGKSVAWAMYAYQTEGNDIFNIRLTFTYPNGPGAYIALANYQTGRWEWKPRAQLTQVTYPLNTTAERDYVSPQGNVYFLALSAGGKDVVITDLTLVVDVPPPPTYSIIGTVTDENSGGMSGVLIGLDVGGKQTTTDVNGTFQFTGLDPGPYTITPSLVDFEFTPPMFQTTIFDKDIQGVSFVGSPVQTVKVTYVSDIAPLIDGDGGNEKSCLECHSGQFPEEGLDLSTYAIVKENASQINIEINRNFDWMPKDGDKWSQENRDLFQAWIDDGLIEQ